MHVLLAIAILLVVKTLYDICKQDPVINESLLSMNELEIKRIVYSKAMQYRQDLLRIVHYLKRNAPPICTRCSENHNNTCTENRKSAV